MEQIKIKYFTDKIDKLAYIDGKSDWIDLRASEEVTLKQGEFALVPLGVAMELPKGYEAHIVPRSSTYKNFGVIQANHCGVVDGSYCGDNDMWRMPVIAMRDTQIHVNDRICQFQYNEKSAGNLIRGSRTFGGQRQRRLWNYRKTITSREDIMDKKKILQHLDHTLLKQDGYMGADQDTLR